MDDFENYELPPDLDDTETALWLCSLIPKYPCTITLDGRVVKILNEHEFHLFVDERCADHYK